MENEELFRLLAGKNSFRLELRSKLDSMIRKESFPKNHIIIKPGQIATRAWFISQGAAMGFAFKEEKKVPLSFWDEHEIMVPIHSFFSQVPSDIYIELLEPTTLLSISFDDVQEMIRSFPETNGYIRKVMEEYQLKSEQRIFGFAAYTPEEHYLYLIKHRPAIFRKASVESIAAYLGISRKTLNRIRNRTRRF